MPYANNKNADQPAHPPSLISVFVVRCPNSIISLDFIFAISLTLLLLAYIAEKSDLILTWSETPEDRFSRDAV